MNYCLYHKHCNDGYGAAYAVWKRFGDQDWTYIPVQYGDPVPEMPNADKIFIVDFSYSRVILDDLANHCAALTVIDHHKTAQQELMGCPYALFDMTESGAVLTWRFLHKEPVPELLRYVQDRDLWRHELPYTHEITAALNIESQTFENWDDIAYNLDLKDEALGSSQLVINGWAILKFKRQLVDQICEKAVWGVVEGHRVKVVNCPPQLASDVGDQLRVEGPFALMFNVVGNKMKCSLRSKDFDVSEIAKKYGGGGHKQAAGFECTLTPNMLIAFET